MAKAKGKGQKPDAGTDGEGIVESDVGKVDDHGPCKDCGNTVDCLIEIHQVLGNNHTICVDCRSKRILDKAKDMVADLKKKAAKVREDMRQMSLPL